jgi:cytochrome c5
VRGLALLLLLAAGGACAQTGGDIYKDKCALCHDGGANAAPRLGVANDWKPRVAKGRPALMRSALTGVPNTAMTAKGGFPELPDAAVVAAVDFMLSTVEIYVSNYSEPPRLDAKPAATARVDDRTLSAGLTQALRGFRGVTFEARSGRVVLKGMVDDARVVANAERAARNVAGVVAVDNKLISAELFEHD